MTRDEQWLFEEKYSGRATEAFEEDRKRLASGEPLAYIIGYQPFLELKIFLDSHPLIPRPETEWWAEQLLESVRDAQTISLEERTERDGVSQNNFSAEKYVVPKAKSFVRLKFLDLCAGSGAIGCAALKTLPNAEVYFGEIDPEHESTILKNISENNLDASRAHIRTGDLFEPFENERFDIIAANPPYVPATRVLDASVVDFEPARALYAGEDGLDLIRRIAKELPHQLNTGGVAWIECDSAHAVAACALFTAQGLSTKIRTDQYGTHRVIVCRHTRARSAQHCCSANIICPTSSP